MIEEKAYAKVNLTLRVLDETKEGYHNLETIMAPITLYDSLYFEMNNENKMVLLDNQIENNSILKAANLFMDRYHTKGATISCVKRIPYSSGLGGGSADSSAVLRGLNRLFDLKIPMEELKLLSEQLGSDNAFCLYNTLAVCRGRGEQLDFLSLPFETYVLLLKPEFGLSTKDVFHAWEKKSKKNNELATENMINAIKEKNIALIDSIIVNDLYEPALSIEPRLQELVEEIEKENCRVHMSGSGSTLFVISNSRFELEKIKMRELTNFSEIYLIKNTLS